MLLGVAVAWWGRRWSHCAEPEPESQPGPAQLIASEMPPAASIPTEPRTVAPPQADSGTQTTQGA